LHERRKDGAAKRGTSVKGEEANSVYGNNGFQGVRKTSKKKAEKTVGPGGENKLKTRLTKGQRPDKSTSGKRS